MDATGLIVLRGVGSGEGDAIAWYRGRTEETISIEVCAAQRLTLDDGINRGSRDPQGHLRVPHGGIAVHHGPLVQTEAGEGRLALRGRIEILNSPFQIRLAMHRKCESRKHKPLLNHLEFPPADIFAGRTFQHVIDTRRPAQHV